MAWINHSSITALVRNLGDRPSPGGPRYSRTLMVATLLSSLAFAMTSHAHVEARSISPASTDAVSQEGGAMRRTFAQIAAEKSQEGLRLMQSKEKVAHVSFFSPLDDRTGLDPLDEGPAQPLYHELQQPRQLAALLVALAESELVHNQDPASQRVQAIFREALATVTHLERQYNLTPHYYEQTSFEGLTAMRNRQIDYHNQMIEVLQRAFRDGGMVLRAGAGLQVGAAPANSHPGR